MTVGTNYSMPVNVNGYLCKNCTDVDYAKKHIDPAHPRSGPYGVNSKSDPTVSGAATIVFGGALSGLNPNLTATNSQAASITPPSGVGIERSGTPALGAQLDLLA